MKVDVAFKAVLKAVLSEFFPSARVESEVGVEISRRVDVLLAWNPERTSLSSRGTHIGLVWVMS